MEKLQITSEVLYKNRNFVPGITSKLEYIKEIGAGAIWLSPIFQSPMYDFGYDIADFYAIHDEYGTMEDFDELLAKANDLGKLSIDFLIFNVELS